MQDEDPKPNEPDSNHQNNNDDSPCSGWDEIANAVANLIERDKIVDSIGNWVDAHAKAKPDEVKFRQRMLLWGYVFSLLIFGGILLAGWRKIIGPEATTGLLGALIGYWYGQYSQRDRRS